MHDRKIELGAAPIRTLLIKYSAPAMIAMFVSSTYNLVGAIFVGQGAGTLALAGLAIAFPIQMVILGVGMMIGIGSASVVSRALGAGDQRKAEQTAGTSFIVTAAIAVLMAAGGWIFMDPMLRLFGATETILPYAADYLEVILLGNVFYAVSVSSNNIVRSEGAAQVAMRSMIIGAVVNFVLDPVFIFGFGMGIRGAAVGTVIANACTFAYLCRYFMSGKSMLRIRRRDLLPHFPIMPEVFRIGGASFFQMILGSIMVIPINHMIGIYGEDMHFAIVGIGNRAMMFFFMPIFGLVQGLQPIIGFNYGARKLDRVIEAVRKAAIYATVLSTGAFLVLGVFTGPVLRLFSPDPGLIDAGVPIIRILILAMPFVGFQMVGGSLFQAIGKSRPAFVISLSRQALLLLPLVLVLPRYFGLTGIWISFPIADTLAIVIAGVWVFAELRALAREIPEDACDDALVAGVSSTQREG